MRYFADSSVSIFDQISKVKKMIGLIEPFFQSKNPNDIMYSRINTAIPLSLYIYCLFINTAIPLYI